MNITKSQEFSLIEVMAGVLLVVYPCAMFSIKGGMNCVFFLLLSLSIYVLLRGGLPPVKWNRDMKMYLAAMAALPIAILLSQSYHHHLSGHPYDAPSRFLLSVPVFMFLRLVRFNVVAMLQYAFPLAVIVGLVMLKPIDDGRFGIATLDLIHFGNFELALGVMSIFSINWTKRDALWLRVFKIIGFLAGVYASIASGSRGGWIALPVFLIIYLHFRFGKVSFKTLIITMLLLMTGFLACTFSYEIHHRLEDVTSDLSAFQQGKEDTSTGIRLQLFNAAAFIAVNNPVFGVGPDGFAHEMDPMQKSGKITALAAELGKGEVHNELLSRAAGLGLFGLLAILSIYLVPAGIFYRAMKSSALQIRKAGLIGIVFVSGFMVFGLTSEALNLTMATAFYALTVAVLLAACLNIHQGEQNLPDNL